MAAWPDYALVGAGADAGAAEDVLRTETETAAVAQAPAGAVSTRTWTLVAEVPGDRIVSFRSWLADARRYFDAPAVLGGGRVRIVNAAAGVALRQVNRRGRPWWVARMTLEAAP